MRKKYQIFISSTFVDLKEERRGIIDAILTLGCFPTGMKMFPASNLEQLEYIKRIIDDSDYYVLIVAGKYGSEAEDGISYTEKEYEYAEKSGIPILAFLKADMENLPSNMIETKKSKRDKLLKFRKKISKNRLVNFWNTPDELKYILYNSLAKEFEINPRDGWVRCDLKDYVIPKDKYVECLKVLLAPIHIYINISDSSGFSHTCSLLHILSIVSDQIESGTLTIKLFGIILANYFAGAGEPLSGYYTYELEKKSLENVLYKLKREDIIDLSTENLNFTSWGIQVYKYMIKNIELYGKVASELEHMEEIQKKRKKNIDEFMKDY